MSGEFVNYLRSSVVEHPRIDWPVLLPAKRKGDASHEPSQKYRENTAALLDAYGIKARWNLMRHELELDIPGFAPEQERAGNANLAYFCELCTRNGLSHINAIDHLLILAHAYHPVRDWILLEPWDGLDRLDALCATISPVPGTDTALSSRLLLRWLVSCVVAVMPQLPGQRPFTPQGVLTLQGKQGKGKTEWIKSLAPSDSQWIQVGVVLDPHDRDSVQQVTSNWIVELGEVDATFKRSDVAALKAFITQAIDIYRAAYARREERTPRRTMLAATVNRRDFLCDETGNRRWWVIAALEFNWRHGINMQQAWAQIWALAQAGSPWWLDAEEIEALSESNAAHEMTDPLIDDLWQTWRIAAVASVTTTARVTIGEIWSALPGREHKTRTRADSSALANALREAGAENETKTNGAATYRVELLKPRQTGWNPQREWQP
jgi:putative DNA primase/helicase